MMRFLDVRTDFAFKKVFGSPHSKDLLLEFLNAILDVGGHPIVDLTIVDPYLVPAIEGMKNTFVDVKATLADDTQIIIEMQVLNIEAMEKRVLYNATKTYSTQLQVGQPYQLLNPVIALTITDFVMFTEPSLEQTVITYFKLLEKRHFISYSEDVELVFVELPKFNQSLTDLVTLTEKWIYFLKHAGHLDGIPPNLAMEPNIHQAFDIASMASLTNVELDVQERKLRWINIQKELREQVELAQQKAQQAEQKAQLAEQKAQLAEQKAQLAEQKAQLAAQQAAQQATQTTILHLAKQLLQAQVDLTLIQQVTGLEGAEIERLRHSLATEIG